MCKRLAAPRVNVHATRNTGRHRRDEIAALVIVQNKDIGVALLRMQYDPGKRFCAPNVYHAFNCNDIR